MRSSPWFSPPPPPSPFCYTHPNCLWLENTPNFSNKSSGEECTREVVLARAAHLSGNVQMVRTVGKLKVFWNGKIFVGERRMSFCCLVFAILLVQKNHVSDVGSG